MAGLVRSTRVTAAAACVPLVPAACAGVTERSIAESGITPMTAAEVESRVATELD